MGRRLPRPYKRLGHVPRHGARHEQAVGVARRGDDVEPEALEVIVRPGERGDLELAGVAGAGVHVADRERAAEDTAQLVPEPGAEALDVGVARRGLGDDPGAEGGVELAEHGSAAPGPARLLAERAQHVLGAHQVVVEDPPRRALLARADDVRAPQDGELRGHRGLVEVEHGLKLVHVPLARAQELEDPDAERVGEGLEEVRFEGLELGGRAAVAHEISYILRQSIHSQFGTSSPRYTDVVSAIEASSEWRSAISRWPARPSARARAGSLTSSRTAAASARASPGGTRRPVSPSRTSSGLPPTVEATTGVPTAKACGITCEVASERIEGSTRTSSAAMTSGMSRRNPVSVTTASSPMAPTRRRTSARPTPSPTTRKRASGRRWSTSRAASRKTLWPLEPRMLARSEEHTSELQSHSDL